MTQLFDHKLTRFSEDDYRYEDIVQGIDDASERALRFVAARDPLGAYVMARLAFRLAREVERRDVCAAEYFHVLKLAA